MSGDLAHVVILLWSRSMVQPQPATLFTPSVSVAGVCSLCLVGGAVWAGCEDGTIVVWHGVQESLMSQSKVHADRVSCLECVGSHVWSGSGDRTIVAHDAHTFQMLYSLSDQGERREHPLAMCLLQTGHCNPFAAKEALQWFESCTC